MISFRWENGILVDCDWTAERWITYEVAKEDPEKPTVISMNLRLEEIAWKAHVLHDDRLGDVLLYLIEGQKPEQHHLDAAAERVQARINDTLESEAAMGKGSHWSKGTNMSFQKWLDTTEARRAEVRRLGQLAWNSMSVDECDEAVTRRHQADLAREDKAS